MKTTRVVELCRIDNINNIDASKISEVLLLQTIPKNGEYGLFVKSFELEDLEKKHDLVTLNLSSKNCEILECATNELVEKRNEIAGQIAFYIKYII